MPKPRKVTVPVSEICELKNRIYGGQYVSYGYRSPIYLEGDLDRAIETLVELREYNKDYDSLELQESSDCECWGSCDCNPKLVLYGTRNENKLERDLRLKEQKE